MNRAKYQKTPLADQSSYSGKFHKLMMAPAVLLLVVAMMLVGCGSDSAVPSATSIPATSAPSPVSTTFSATTRTSTTAAVGTTATSTTSMVATTAPSVTGAPAEPQAAVVTSTATTNTPPGGTTANGNSTSLAPTGNLELDIQNVVTAVKPSVVLIAVTTPQAQGVGTGSVITSDGFILTNFHVVAAEGASVSSQTQIQVVMSDGKKFPAKVVGTDRANDLAVVKIEATGLSVIKQGSSSALQVGQWVVAVGNALALPGGPTVTAGIVGALGRSIQEPGPASANLTDLIQTNAAINPGNSGGPLLNLNGEIVGINTAAPVDPTSQSAAQGIGFAISIDQAKPIIQTLMSGKSIVPPYMGILPQTLTPGLAAQFRLTTDTGVLIRTVEPNSAAASAGWKAGDIITQMDGTKITSLADLQTVLNRHKPGDKVSATLVTTKGQTEQTTITFSQPPNQ